MVLYSGYIAVWAMLNPSQMPPPEPKMSLREKLRELAQLIPCLLLIALVFVVLLTGWATATECAAWGVLGSLAIAWWSGSLTRKAFWDSVMGTTRLTGMIMLILAGASFMSTSMGYTGIPVALAAWVDSLKLSPYHADRGADRDVHHPRRRARRHLDDRADHGRSFCRWFRRPVSIWSGSESSWCSSSRWPRYRHRSGSICSCYKP